MKLSKFFALAIATGILSTTAVFAEDSVPQATGSNPVKEELKKERETVKADREKLQADRKQLREHRKAARAARKAKRQQKNQG